MPPLIFDATFDGSQFGPIVRDEFRQGLPNGGGVRIAFFLIESYGAHLVFCAKLRVGVRLGPGSRYGIMAGRAVRMAIH